MLDTDPKLAAQAHIDRHVVKMLIEYAQILSAAHRIWTAPEDIHPDLYRLTHKNHPSVKWAALNRYNYTWLHALWISLHEEYRHRYGATKWHASYGKLWTRLYAPPYDMPLFPRPDYEAPFTSLEMKPEHQAVGDLKQNNPVDAYREYYRTTKVTDAKGKLMAIWTNRGKPEWF